MARKAEPVLEYRAILGEGAVWHRRIAALLWVDIIGKKVFVYNPLSGGNRQYDVGQMVGTVVPRAKGGVVVALQDQVASLDLETGAVERMVFLEENDPHTRANDGKSDPAGRFWIGTMGLGARQNRKNGTLYRIDKDLSVHPVLPDVRTSNGIVWSADSTTMYYVDSPTYRIDAFDFNLATGSISNRRAVVEVARDNGVADGIWLDVEGCIWAARWGGSQVTRFDPSSGKVIDVVEVPGARNVTSCAFGGTDLATMYITTAREGLDSAALERYPESGKLFAVQAGVPGIAAHEFAG